MARVAVTGGTGFIGKSLVKRLVERGETVRVLVHRRERLPAEISGVSTRRGDVTDPATLTDFFRHAEVVYHLAGLNLARSQREFMHVNAAGTENIARACAASATPPVLLYVSSLAAAGPNRGDQPRREEDAPAPVSNYGRSKLAAEQRLRQYAERLPITVVRPPSVIGPDDPYLLSLFQLAHRGYQILFGSKPQRFSFIYVEDLVDGLLLAAERGRRLEQPAATGTNGSAGTYYLAQPETPTLAEVGGMVLSSVGGSRLHRISMPTWACWAVAGAGEIAARCVCQRWLVCLDKMREAAAGSWTCCPERSWEELGFRTPCSLAERIGLTAEGYRERGWLSHSPGWRARLS